MCAVDHKALRWAALGGQRGEDAVEHAQTAPTDEVVVERLMGTVGRGRVAPLEAMSDQSAAGAGGDLRWRHAHGGGAAWQCHLADRQRLAGAVQRRGSGRAGRPQGARPHAAADVVVPDNITLLPLPPKCPELNVMENVWQFMRDNWLSNRVFTSHENIVELCCEAWNKLIDQPWRIMTIGHRNWASGL